MTMSRTLPYDPEKIALKVGLEIHRQLSTQQKLFCACSQVKEDGSLVFLRRLRPSQSELGEVDPAALFEASKSLWLKYHAGSDSSCLVEADEEPPHDLNGEALESALMVSSLLGSKVVDEIHVMRKMVIDGSNTTGFQRTMVVALGGAVKTSIGDVPVLSVTLEEDAARNLDEREGERDFALDRLGIPLIEISLAPVTASPEEVEEVAAAVGRLLKSTGRVARGLGTIRQDINVSIFDGPVVEVKGVQQLDLVAKVVDYEAKRQLWLVQLAEKLRGEGIKESDIAYEPIDCGSSFVNTKSNLILSGLRRGYKVYGLKAPGFAGHLSEERWPNVRLGRELADVARFFKLGGLLHSDELPAYGVTQDEVDAVRRRTGCGRNDAFILIVGEESRALLCMKSLVLRLKQALSGPPAETRGPMEDGGTRYIRPRPGSARMYPETDIPPLPISRRAVEEASKKLPPPWEEQVSLIMEKHRLGREQAEHVLESEYYDLFEKAVEKTAVAPTFLATFLTETLVSLQREGLEPEKASADLLMELIVRIGGGKLAKEAAPDVLRAVLSGKAKGVDDAVKSLNIVAMTDEELVSLVASVIKENEASVTTKGEAAFSMLMGRVMAKAKGRADGAKVSEELRRQLKQSLAKTVE